MHDNFVDEQDTNDNVRSVVKIRVLDSDSDSDSRDMRVFEVNEHSWTKIYYQTNKKLTIRVCEF
jgi:hypothetical protein